MRAKPQNFLRHREPVCQLFSNIAMSTYPNMLEPLLGPNIQSLSTEMDEKFPPINPHPKENIAAIMYKAGQRSVVEWYQERIDNDGDPISTT